MGTSKTYSRKEISRILSRASEIQASQNIGEVSADGLTEEELQHVADEVGIGRDVLQEALLSYDVSSNEESFNWLNATSNIQRVSRIPGEIDEEKWNEIVHEIRRVTGGIGKVHKMGNSFEWEQRRKDIGYKHISLSPGQEYSKIQYVSNWRGMKRIAGIFSFLTTFTVTAIALDGTNFNDISALLIAVGGGLLGLPFGHLFIKSYYEKQKKQAKELFAAISTKMNPPRESSISIEDRDVYSNENDSKNLSKEKPHS